MPSLGRLPTCRLGVVVLASAVLGGCHGQAVGPAPPAADSVGAGSFVLLHTNDMHCHFRPTAARWLDGAPPIGGFLDLDAYLRTVRAREDAVLLLDAGDLLSGTPLSELELEGVRGGHVARFVEQWGYDAWAVGNHEFDGGFDELSAFVAFGKVPALCSNLHSPDGGPAMPGLEPARVFEVGGLQVGVIGVITDDLERFVSRESWERVALEDSVQAVTRQVERLDPQTDLLVVLSHSGLEADRMLADRISGIDLIVGGHSHDALQQPERRAGVYVVQAGSYARSVGRLDIRVEDDAIVSLEGRLVDLVPDEGWLQPAAAVREHVEVVTAEVDERYGRVVGTAPVEVRRDSYLQGPLGSWICERLLVATGSDVAVYNSGGIRADLPAGDITYAHVYQVLPFSNTAVTFTATGAEIEGFARRNAFAEATRETSALQCAGLEWSWRPEGSTQEMVSVTVGGEPLDPEREYTVVTNSYLATHIEQSLRLSSRPIEPSELRVLDVVVRALAEGPLEAPPARSMRAE